jgi:hypothetical protein
MTATHVAVKQLTRRVKGNGLKLYMDKFFSFSGLYNSLTKQKINCFSTFRPSTRGMLDDFRSRTLKLKEGDVWVWMSCGVTALAWKDKNEVQVLTDMYNLQAEGNFGGEIGNALRPAVLGDHNTTWITFIIVTKWLTAPLINHHMWKWTKKQFLCPLNLTFLNSHILLSSVVLNSCRDIWLTIVINMIERAGTQLCPQQTYRQAIDLAARIGCLEKNSHQHQRTATGKRMDSEGCNAQTQKRC